MTRADVVSAARGWLGTPYRHQASLRGIGCDCLGLLRGVWRELVGPEPAAPPPYTRGWAEASGRDALAEAACRHLLPIAPGEAEAGDVVLFRWREHLPAKHCAILTGRTTMIHAQDGAAVSEVSIPPVWARRVAGSFRLPGLVA